MAYREFKNEYYYAPPNIDVLPRTLQVLNSVAQQRAYRQRQQQDLQNNYRIATEKGFFPSIQKRINDQTQVLVDRLNKHWQSGGQGIPSDVQQGQAYVQGEAKRGEALWNAFKAKEQQITDLNAQNNFYDPTADSNRLKSLLDGNLSADQIEEGLNNFKPAVDPLRSYKIDDATAKYVNDRKTESKTVSNTSRTGAKVSNKVEAVFLDENGVPRVTDEHVIDYLNNPDISRYHQAELNQQLLNEADKMMASKQGEFLKGMDPEEVITELRTHPEKNLINSSLPGERERELAKQRLELKNRQNLENSTDFKDVNPDAARGITSKKYGVANTFDTNNFGGPGGVFVNKQTGINGITIPIRGAIYNKNKNEISGTPSSEREFVATLYNLLPIDKSTGAPPPAWIGKSPEEIVGLIQNMSPEEASKYDLKTVIQGQSYNKADLSFARTKAKDLRLKSNRTEEENGKLAELENTLEEYDQNPELAAEIIQSKLGVVVDDGIKVVEPGDATESQLKGKLGDFRITDPKNYTPEMAAIAQAWSNKKRAIPPGTTRFSKNVGKSVGPSKPKKPTLPTVDSQESYNALPSGAEYLDPDGVKRRKK